MTTKRSAQDTRSYDLLEKRIRSSRRALLVERIWPCAWPPLALALFFALVSLLGLWTVLAGPGRHIGLALFAMAGIASLIPLARIDWPGRDEAVRRLEKASGVPHRPASAYDDTLTSTGNITSDRQARTVWQAHRDRLAAMFARLRPGTPRPRIDRRDPFALRAALLLATVLAALFVWPVAGERLMSAFSGAAPGTTLEARIDAWVTPPHYTRKAPVMLADGSIPQVIGTDEARMLEIPSGSALVVRASGVGKDAVSVTFRADGTEEVKSVDAGPPGTKSTAGEAAAPPQSRSGIAEFHYKLTVSGVVSLSVNASRLKGWRFKVTPDTVPEIKLTKPAGRSARGALSLSYRITDDYGITGAEAAFRLTEKSRKEAGATAESAKSLWPAPKFPLRMPRRNARIVDARTYQDLTAHPWAGLEVAMTLSARDQAGQIGRSKDYIYRLPAREFAKPLARAIVEQRRNLAINPDGRGKVATAIDALTIAPELFSPDRTVYLGLRSVYWRLARDKSDEALKTTVDQLWHIALRVEDGDLSRAEQDLRDAQDRLSEALKNGASEQEISRLTQELREAMNRFMRSLQRQAEQRNPQQQARQSNPNSRQLSRRDLDKMLRDIEKLARSGSREAAQQMLEQLRNMLEQLQTAQNNPKSGRMQQTMQEFGDLIRNQQRLLDDTFKARQGRGRNGKKGQRQGQQGRNGEGQQGRDGSGRSKGLGRRQGSLRSNLGRLLDSLEGFGGQTPKQLQDAQRAMRGAEQSLEESDLDRATRQQSQALDQLRQGAQQLAEEMLRGVAGQVGQRPRDPLGRSRDAQNNGSQTGEGVKIPGEIDVQKARRILEELRRRASDPNRPTLELDYIERLLERF